MKMKKFLAAVCAMSLAVAMLAGCGGGNKDADKGAEKKEDSKVVIVGTNPTFPPFEFQDNEGNMSGFDLDLMRAIGEEEGFSVEFKSMTFESLAAAVQNGEINVIAAGMSITPERQKQLNFSKPYMDASLGIFVAADNDTIKDIDGLKGKKVISQTGTTGAEEVTNLQKDGKIGEAKLLDDYNTCFLDLANGGSDALIIDLPVAQAYMKKNPDKIKMLGEPYSADFYGLATAKNNKELADKLSSGLDKLIKNGKYEELCKKYELPVPESIMKGTAKVPEAK